MHQNAFFFRLSVMKRKNQQNFDTSAVKAPEGLSGRILLSIEQEKKLRVIRRRLAAYLAVFCVSILAVVPLFVSAYRSLTASGFFDFAWLIVTDAPAIASFWQIFAVTLLEALPIFTISALLVAILASMESLKLLARDYKLIKI